MSLTRDEAIKILEKDQPNLAAILIGCVSGKSTEWPMMQSELIALMTHLEQTTKERDECWYLLTLNNGEGLQEEGRPHTDLGKLCAATIKQLVSCSEGANVLASKWLNEKEQLEQQLADAQSTIATLTQRVTDLTRLLVRAHSALDTDNPHATLLESIRKALTPTEEPPCPT